MDNKIKVSQLPECTDLTGLYTLGVDGSNSSVKVGLEFLETASKDAEEAAENANDAAAKADTAADRAETAVSDAEKAVEDAQTAVSDAEKAVSDAQTAVSKAEEAAENANDAAAKADTAADRAETAVSDAEKAVSDAQKAVESAESASKDAEAAAESANDAAANANTAADRANKVADGVYAAYALSDGTERLVAYDDVPEVMASNEWVGAVVVEGARAVLVAREDCASGARWGATGDTHGAMCEDESQMWHDYDGHLNTALANLADVGYGMETAHEYSYGNLGKGRWHMGSGGEWGMVARRYDEVNAMLSHIGGTPLTDGYYYWTSTQYDADGAWQVCPSSGEVYWDGKYNRIVGNSNNVRAFAAFSLNA